jgi:hypothetical protein
MAESGSDKKTWFKKIRLAISDAMQSAGDDYPPLTWTDYLVIVLVIQGLAALIVRVIKLWG